MLTSDEIRLMLLPKEKSIWIEYQKTFLVELRKTVTNPTYIEKKIVKMNINHLNQAEGILCTIYPI